MTGNITIREIKERFPLLIKALQWYGILSVGESACLIIGLKENSPYSCEAVNHSRTNQQFWNDFKKAWKHKRMIESR